MHRNKLKEIKRIELLIDRKREQLERTRSLAESMTTRLKVTGIKGTAEREDARLRIIELEEEISRQIDKLIDTKLEVMKIIDDIDNADVADILYMRYFEHMKWEEIANRKHYSLDWVFKLHREGLKKYF